MFHLRLCSVTEAPGCSAQRHLQAAAPQWRLQFVLLLGRENTAGNCSAGDYLWVIHYTVIKVPAQYHSNKIPLVLDNILTSYYWHHVSNVNSDRHTVILRWKDLLWLAGALWSHLGLDLVSLSLHFKHPVWKTWRSEQEATTRGSDYYIISCCSTDVVGSELLQLWNTGSR